MCAEFNPSASYDAVPYSSYPYAKSHPRNLAALATLFGMWPPDVTECRVLEIGCAAGGNLLPMAITLPEAQLYGIDASQRQIASGQQVIDDLGLGNVRLQRRDILDFDGGVEEFDYIICHGVYSWVSSEVQRKILEICREHLSASGVAYISYNTYPGWYLRGGVREMMRYHAAGFDDVPTKIEQSRALLDFLISAVPSDGGAYEMLLHDELQILLSCEDSYLFHEHLEDCNEPLFFHQFVDRAERANLRFLCEAHFSSMLPAGFPDEIQQTIARIAPDIIQSEQYLDFLRNRKFRQTLLCHQDVRLTRTIPPEHLEKLCLSAPLVPVETIDADAREHGQTFEHRTGKTVTVTTPIQKSAFVHLSNIWPAEILMADLVAVAWQAIPGHQRPTREACRGELGGAILECFTSDLLDVFACASPVISTVSDTPLVSSLARYQAHRGRLVTNLRHENVQLSDFDRVIIRQLDGSVAIAEIASDISRRVEQNELSLEDVDTPNGSEAVDAVRQSLIRIAQAALLIG